MKDLFISMGEHISVRNFTDGPLIYRALTASEIAMLVEETLARGGRVRAYFDFGSVPSERKRREFQELVDAFEKITGVRLSVEEFTLKAESDSGETFPNFNFIPTITDSMSMLAVEYFFSHQEGTESFDDMFTISDNTMNFHFFERANLKASGP